MNDPTGHRCESPRLGRRQALLGLGATLALLHPGLAIAAAPGDARLVIINALGGLDGLAAVPAYGDRNLLALRQSLLPTAPVGTPGGLLDLGGYFGLHPAMPNFYSMFRAGQGLVVHAVGNCATTRSHFEGQDYLQSGAPELLASGWLNRLSGLVPAPPGGTQSGIAIDTACPLLMRGPTTVAGWAPEPFARIPPALASRVAALAGGDPLIGPALQVGLADRAAFNVALGSGPRPSAGLPSLVSLAWGAGELLAASSGPRIAALETTGFDTHADQVNRLDASLALLDQALLALRTSLGAAWANTVVMTITEFGRTAAANGSGGTDHDTAFAMFLAGGAVAGGRVLAQWPGLGPSQLFQGRDLAPTVDYRAVVLGVLQQHLQVPASAATTIFPGISGIAPMSGLVTS